MSHLPLRRGLPTRGNPGGRGVGAPENLYRRLVTTITDPDLITVIAFCALGLLVTLNVILRFPDFGLLVGQLGQLP